MNNNILLEYYDIADEYMTETVKLVSGTERDTLAYYFQQLTTCLMNNEEINEEAQQKMATAAGVDAQRIDGIVEFLNRWGNEQPKIRPVFYTTRKLSRYTLQVIGLIRRKQ